MAATCPSSEVAWIPADLAPGDAGARFDPSSLRVRRIRSADDPSFAVAYDRLWAEFGERGEMEARAVIASRLAWDPARPIGRYRYLYEMLVVERGDEIVAVRDHTAIVPADVASSPVAAIVHLSHVLIEPAWRGTGMAAWLRAFPLQAARECAAARGGASGRITLVAEMEPLEHADPTTVRRLASYARAGFRKIDPESVHYAQPDFRAREEIAATEVRPVPLVLLVRRVGREDEREISGEEVRRIVAALYEMFAVHLRPEHMARLWAIHDALPPPEARVALIPPTQ